MKNTLSLISFVIINCQLIFGQQTVQKVEYWDYFQTQKKRVWHELGDGTWHGDVKFYKRNGILEYHTIMNYGKVKDKTWYFQDGSVMIKIKNNDEGVKNGIQEFYNFSNGVKYLKAWANISNGVVKEYKSYFKKDVLKLIYTFDGSEAIFKRLNEDGSVAFEVKTKDGFISDISNYFGITIKNNRFEKVGINILTLEIKDERYFVYTKYPHEPKKFSHYKIPENQYFQLESVFNYSDIHGIIEFDLDLYLQIKNEDSYSFSLILNNSDYDKTNKFNYSVIALRDYFNNLTLDGLFTSYDNIHGNRFEIFYLDGKETWKKNYYNSGALKNYAHEDTLMEYNENEVLIKEIIADDFRIFNNEGKLIDSKEIRSNYVLAREEFSKVENAYKSSNDATNEIIRNDFCIDIETGQFINNQQCISKNNENIIEAFRVLHLDYIKSWKTLIPEFEMLNSIEKSLPWNSNTHFLEKTDIYEAKKEFYEKYLTLISNFSHTIEKFNELLNSPDIRRHDRSLRRASTSNEIKTIVGL